MLAALDQDPCPRRPADGGHGGGGDRKDQSAGAADDQHGHRPAEIAGDQPGDERAAHDQRGEVFGEPVDQGDGFRLVGLSLGNQPDHLAKRGVFPDPLGPKTQQAIMIESAGIHRISRLLFAGHRLAGDGRFVQRRRAFRHHAVHRHLLAGLDQEDIAHPHLFHRHRFHLPARKDSGLFRRDLDQGLDRFASRLGSGFLDEGTKHHDGADHRRGEKLAGE